jgi:hypothetical protein
MPTFINCYTNSQNPIYGISLCDQPMSKQRKIWYMEYYSAEKKVWNCIMCIKIDRTEGYHVEQTKPSSERKTSCFHSYSGSRSNKLILIIWYNYKRQTGGENQWERNTEKRGWQWITIDSTSCICVKIA